MRGYVVLGGSRHGRREGDSPPIAQMRPMATQISTDRGRYRCVSVSVGDAISAISGQECRGGDSPQMAQMRRKRRHGYPRIGEGIGVKQAGVSRLWPRGGADAPPAEPDAPPQNPTPTQHRVRRGKPRGSARRRAGFCLTRHWPIQSAKRPNGAMQSEIANKKSDLIT